MGIFDERLREGWSQHITRLMVLSNLAAKPYVSGAAYIHRMSDYCRICRFEPKKVTGGDSCPFTALYWTFLERNADKLANNPRMSLPLMSMRKKPAAEMRQLRERAAQVTLTLCGESEVANKEQ